MRTNPLSYPWVSDALGPLPSAFPTIRNIHHMTPLPQSKASTHHLFPQGDGSLGAVTALGPRS